MKGIVRCNYCDTKISFGEKDICVGNFNNYERKKYIKCFVCGNYIIFNFGEPKMKPNPTIEEILKEFDEKFHYLPLYRTIGLSDKEVCVPDELKKFIRQKTTEIVEGIEKDIKHLKLKGIYYDKGSNSRIYQESRNQTITDVIKIVQSYK